MIREDLSGKTFGAWVVIRFDKLKNNNSYWICKCQCGQIKSVQRVSLIRSNFPMCSECSSRRNEKSLIGKRFGKLLVLSNSNRKSYVTCVCDCGEIKDIFRGALTSGKSSSCGNIHYKDYIGIKYGRWLILSLSNNVSKLKNNKYFLCRCDCGTEKEVSLQLLKSKKSRSCGCLKSELLSKRPIKIKESKYKWYFIKFDGSIQRCRSSFEVFVWNYFNYIESKEIKYEYRAFKIEENKRYTPDFYIVDDDYWIETKGSFFKYRGGEFQMDKILKTIEIHNIKILIFFWDDILKNCKLPFKSLSTYYSKAEKINVKIEDYLAKMLYMV